LFRVVREKENCVSDPGFRPEDENDGFVPTPGGLLDGLPEQDTGSGLSLIMESKDIATIPGLPQHVYDDAARYAGQQATPDAGAGAAGASPMVAAATNSQAAPAPSDTGNDGESVLDDDIRKLKDEAVDRAVSTARGRAIQQCTPEGMEGLTP